jgi:hypothetical protein
MRQEINAGGHGLKHLKNNLQKLSDGNLRDLLVGLKVVSYGGTKELRFGELAAELMVDGDESATINFKQVQENGCDLLESRQINVSETLYQNIDSAHHCFVHL